MKALIGHTGFVGSNLLRATEFGATFNSRNFHDLAGRHFDEVVCAGVSAAKWLANRDPEADWGSIRALLQVLEQAKIGRFVLISTIDVYPDPASGLDESADLDGQPNHAYGTNRFAIEAWVRARYGDHLIIRLPALFGSGLKKNVLYDLLNDKAVEQINPAGVFQWYPVARLASDMEVAASAGLKLVNLFTAPLPMSKVINRFFPGVPVGPERQPAPRYALKTRYAPLFGGHDGWVTCEEEVMQAMSEYVASVRAGQS